MPEMLGLRQIQLDRVTIVSNVRKEFDQEKMRELEASVKAMGILQPILVAQRDDGNYRLVAGERRVRAARAVGHEGIPAMVAEMTEAEIVECQVVENLQREDVSAIEEAEGFCQLVEVCKMTQEQVAKRIGISQSQVANRLRLLRLPAEVKDKIIARQITAGHGMALLRLLPDGKARPGSLFGEALKDMTEGEISVQRAQAEVDGLIWSRGRALVQTKQQNPSWQPSHETLFDPKAECLENPKSGRCPYVIDVKPKGYAKAELRCVSPKCWESKQKAAWARIEAERKKAEAAKDKGRRQAESAKPAKPKEVKVPAPKVPPASPLENADVRAVQRLGRAAWSVHRERSPYERNPYSRGGAVEFRRECYLPLEDLLKHFAARAKLGASNMPATMKDLRLWIPEQWITLQTLSNEAAVLELDQVLAQFKLKTGAHYGDQFTLEDKYPTGPAYYCATVKWSTNGDLEQRLAIPLGGRTLVIVSSDSVMMRRELRPRWYNLLQGLPASPVSCIPIQGKKPPVSREGLDCDGCSVRPNCTTDEDIEACRADSDPEDDLVQPPRVGGEHGLGPNQVPSDEEHIDQIALAAVNGCGNPKKKCTTCATKSCNSRQAMYEGEDDLVQPPRVGGEDIIGPHDGGKPLACKDCGLRPCGPDTRKLCKGEVAG